MRVFHESSFNSPWWKFTTDGELYTSPSIYQGMIYIGDSNGHVYAINQKTGKPVWTRTLDHAVTSPFVFDHNITFFTTDDGALYALRATTGEESWRFSTPQAYKFVESPTLYGNMILISDAGGTLYALQKTSGKVMWQFHSRRPLQASFIQPDKTLRWRFSFSKNDANIFFAGMDGYIYALQLNTGRIVWEFNTGGSITTYPEISQGKVYIGNQMGDSYALDQQHGHVVWHSKIHSAVTCLVPGAGTYSDVYPTPFSFIAHILVPQRNIVIRTSSDGVVTALNSKGNNLWTQQMKVGIIQCPTIWKSSVFVADKETLRSLTINNGHTQWSVSTKNTFLFPPYIFTPAFYIDTQKSVVMFNTPLLFVADSRGVVRAINGASGIELWQTHCSGAVYQPPVIRANRLYYACTDGGVYAVNALSGTYAIRLSDIAVSQSIQSVAHRDIQEFTISHDDHWYGNPYEDVAVQAVFQQHGRNPITIDGFYYDKNTWKVRFNPPEKGVWTWKLFFKTPFGNIQRNGSFISNTDTHTAFLKISKQNPSRITLDNQTIFNGLGIEDTIKDTNDNGTPLDDWSIGTGHEVTATSSEKKAVSIPNIPISLDAYADTYASSAAGFNIFRWSVNNASFNLWDTFTPHSKYLVREGKDGDALVQSLSNHGFHIWLTMFNFGIPFTDSQLPWEVSAVQRYIRYVIARYGAYTSLWEIANESYASDAFVTRLAKEIASVDYEHRPISMSWEHPSVTSINIVAPHWYNTDEPQNADVDIAGVISKYTPFQKPVLFGEVGNTTRNWDPNSALIMRVRGWVAFFKSAILVFWNQSSSKDYYNPDYKNANIYIGSEERDYMKQLTDFTSGISLSAKEVPLTTNSSAVRAYGLQSDRELIGYFYHYLNPFSRVSVSVSINLPQPAALTWIDPTDGKILSEQQCMRGSQIVTSPYFFADVALRARYIRN